MAKINISINDELLERLDKVATANYVTRSGYISQALANQLNSYELVMALREMGQALTRIAEKADINDDDKKQLDDLNKVITMLSVNVPR